MVGALLGAPSSTSSCDAGWARRLTQQLNVSLVEMITTASEFTRNTLVCDGNGNMRCMLVG